MVRYYYYKYNCQVCGKRTKTNQSMYKEGLKAPTCLVCHKVMCYKCKIGGYCKNCIELFPEDIRKPYEKKAKILKMFTYFYTCITYLMALTFISTFIIIMVAPEYEEIAKYSLFTSFVLLGYIICPGLIIQFIVKSIESDFSDKGARKLILRLQHKEKFF